MSFQANKKDITVLIVDRNIFTFQEFLKDVPFLKNNNVKFKSLTDYRDGNVDLDTLDLALFTGGSDVNPDLYAEVLGKHTSINSKRDIEERNLFQNLNKTTLKVGICRGAQFLNVMSGGRLIQHVEGHTSPHTISTPDSGVYTITSTHHQMMYPYDVRSHSLIAWSTYFKSNTYLDGKNNEIDIPINFLEPEIVYFDNTHSLCIQGHPEFTECDSNTVEYCRNLISNALITVK